MINELLIKNNFIQSFEDFAFKDREMYKTEVCDNKKYYICLDCSKRFEIKSNCVRHIKRETPCVKSSTICEDCGVDFLYECKLQRHKGRKYKCNAVYQCSIFNKDGCSEIFPFKSLMERHIKTAKCKVKKEEIKEENKKNLS